MIEPTETNIKLVESTPITVQPVPTEPWTTTAYNGIRDGAWAVILVMALSYTAMRGVVGRYLDKHMSLLDTMKDSLGKNADSLRQLSEAERIQNAVQSKQGDALEMQGRALLEQGQILAEITNRQKEVVSKSFALLQDNAQRITTIENDRKDAIQEHQRIAIEINELKTLSEHHQQELIDKLDTIEDLYRSAEEATGQKARLQNFWRKPNDRK